MGLVMEAVDWRDMYEERAAIMEHDGKLQRAVAEKRALEEVRKKRSEYGAE